MSQKGQAILSRALPSPPLGTAVPQLTPAHGITGHACLNEEESVENQAEKAGPELRGGRKAGAGQTLHWEQETLCPGCRLLEASWLEQPSSQQVDPEEGTARGQRDSGSRTK